MRGLAFRFPVPPVTSYTRRWCTVPHITECSEYYQATSRVVDSTAGVFKQYASTVSRSGSIHGLSSPDLFSVPPCATVRGYVILSEAILYRLPSEAYSIAGDRPIHPLGSEKSTHFDQKRQPTIHHHIDIDILSSNYHHSENHTHRHLHNIKARVKFDMTATTTARRPPSTVAVGPRAIVLNESPSVTPSGSYSAANSNGVTVNIIGIGESRSFSCRRCRRGWW